MSARTSRVQIPNDIGGGWYATLGMLHLNDAFADGRTYARRLPDDLVRDGREKRDRRIIERARAARRAVRASNERAGDSQGTHQ